jgi:hypothetical protein
MRRLPSWKVTDTLLYNVVYVIWRTAERGAFLQHCYADDSKAETCLLHAGIYVVMRKRTRVKKHSYMPHMVGCMVTPSLAAVVLNDHLCPTPKNSVELMGLNTHMSCADVFASCL